MTELISRLPALPRADLPADRVASHAQKLAELPGGKLAFNVKEFCAAVGIGPTKTYAEIKDGRLQTVWVAGRRLIMREDAEQWLLAGREEDKHAPP
jgi:hypothetical protein